MKTSLKKLVAGASIVALVLTNLAFTNAAVPTAVINIDDDIVITDARFLSSQDEDDLTVYLNTIAVAVGDLTLAYGSLTIAWTFTSASVYNVSYIHNDGTTNFAWAVVVNWADAHEVTVTATVLPILSMTLTNTALDFGELSVDSLNTTTQSTTVTASTNATDGFQISLASQYAALESENWDRIEYSSAGTEDATNNTDQFYRFALANANNVTLVDNNGYANIALAATPVVIANTWNNPVTWANFTVQPQAWITTNTAAWNYSDTLTFSITWTF